MSHQGDLLPHHTVRFIPSSFPTHVRKCEDRWGNNVNTQMAVIFFFYSSGILLPGKVNGMLTAFLAAASLRRLPCQTTYSTRDIFYVGFLSSMKGVRQSSLLRPSTSYDAVRDAPACVVQLAVQQYINISIFRCGHRTAPHIYYIYM